MPGEKRKISKSKGSEPESKRIEVDVQEQAAKFNFDTLANIENPNVESLINISDLLKVRIKNISLVSHTIKYSFLTLIFYFLNSRLF